MKQEAEKIQRAGEFADIEEILDIVASAHMGIWRIELVDGEEPRMYVDDTMKELLGIAGQECTPEKTYTDWFSQIAPEAVESVLYSVGRMESGYFDENTYLWMHPTKGIRYVRCGGTAQKIEGGFILRGYHYDVDETIRREQEQKESLEEALEEKREYYNTLGTLGGIFYSMHVLDLREDTVAEFNSKNEVKEIVNRKQGAAQMMVQVMSAVTVEDYLEEALVFTDLLTLPERMRNKKVISKELLGKNIGWFIASFIAVEQGDDGSVTKVIYTTRVIDEEKKEKDKLIRKSQTDELTGLFNRRAYEEDLDAHGSLVAVDDFIYISMDVNGLKVVNDTKGHMAGDELIIGACQCMKESLGAYGKLYRVGGDEFVAILFLSADKIKDVLDDFNKTIENWSGTLVDSLSISYGYICKKEKPEMTVRQLGSIAEQRMYEDKDAYYKKFGFDRRGQRDAHKALCDLYTKILKINITEDTYQIVNMDISEQTKDKGFSDKISQWLISFGKTGQVHPDDLEQYLRLTDLQYMKEYFAENKTSLHIFYRRKNGDVYKQVMMEIIPANDYKENSQSLFLYVKSIDK